MHVSDSATQNIKTLDEYFDELKKKLAAFHGQDLAPGQDNFKTTRFKVSAADLQRLEAHEAGIVVMTRIEWNDGNGNHVTEACGLFGLRINVYNVCPSHNTIR